MEVNSSRRIAFSHQALNLPGQKLEGMTCASLAHSHGESACQHVRYYKEGCMEKENRKWLFVIDREWVVSSVLGQC